MKGQWKMGQRQEKTGTRAGRDWDWGRKRLGQGQEETGAGPGRD